MNFLTDFADQAVVLPVAGAVLLGLLLLGWRRGALAWAASVAGVQAVMLLLKLATLSCGRYFAWSGLVSPSGHTAAAAMVYGGLLTLLAPASAAGAALTAAFGGVIALVFGLSRIALRVHTPADVAVGAAVGVAGAVLMRRFSGTRPPALSVSWVAVPAVLAMLAFHGSRLDAEPRIHWLAEQIWPFSACR